MLEKYATMQHIWPYGGAPGNYRLALYIFRKLSSSWC